MATGSARGGLVVLVLATTIILVCVYLNYSQQFTVMSLYGLKRLKLQIYIHSRKVHTRVFGCEVPKGGYKAWNDGLLTTVSPVIDRKCIRLFEGDSKEAERVKEQSKKWANALPDDAFLKRASSCSWLKEQLTDNLYNSELEKQFPLAYSFVIHTSPQQIFRLLKVLYKPQNTYCFHYDKKSTPLFKSLFDTMATCFDNIIIPSKIEDVQWGKHTFLDAQINCLRDLAKHRETRPKALQWNYVINLCGKELPLTTGKEIVSRLMRLNGTSSMSPGPNTNKQRLKGKKVPFNLPTYKNSAYNALSFPFIDYILNNKTAQTVLEFFRTVSVPEEHFYSTLYKQPGVPGGFNPKIPQDDYFRVARALWCFRKDCMSTCKGQWVHSVCVVTSGDLPVVLDYQRGAGYLFHNKYFMEMDHTVMDCAEEVLVERNIQEYIDECKSTEKLAWSEDSGSGKLAS
jgi:hypothetical protein